MRRDIIALSFSLGCLAEGGGGGGGFRPGDGDQ